MSALKVTHLLVVVALSCSLVVVASPTASAHGICKATVEYPHVSGGRIIAHGSGGCSERHYRLDLLVELWKRVNGTWQLWNQNFQEGYCCNLYSAGDDVWVGCPQSGRFAATTWFRAFRQDGGLAHQAIAQNQLIGTGSYLNC
jgi:hypothetical protein